MGHDGERRLGAFLSDYVTPVSVWRVDDHRLSTDMYHYNMCRHVCVVWGQVAHHCHAAETAREEHEHRRGGG